MRALVSLLALVFAAGEARATTVKALFDQDTYLDQGSPSAANGAFAELFVTMSKTGPAKRSLVRADLSGVKAGAIVQKATLFLYAEVAGGGALDLHRALDPWDEKTSWATQPAFEPVPSSTADVPGGGFIEFDVTDDVRAFAYGEAENLGWLLKWPSEKTGNATTQFWSKDYATPGFEPHVVVELVASPIGVGTGDPFASVDEALAALPKTLSSTVEIVLNPFAEHAGFTISGFTGKAGVQLVVRGDAAGTPIVSGGGAAVISVAGSVGVSLKNLRIDAGAGGQHGVHVEDSKAVFLSLLDVRGQPGGGAGILIEDVSLGQVSRSRITSGHTGVVLTGAETRDCQVHDNEVLRQTDAGISIDDGAGANLVVQNTLVDTGPLGISLLPSFPEGGAGPDNVLANNAVRTGGYAFAWQGDALGLPPAGTFLDYNAIELTGEGQAAKALDFGTWVTSADLHADTGLALHHVEGDLLFADPDPLADEAVSLEVGSIEAGYPIDSPLLDAGTEIGASALSMAGVARPQGVATDLGAHEDKRTPRSPDLPDLLTAEVLDDTALVGQPVDLHVLALNSAGFPAMAYAGEVEVLVTAQEGPIATFTFDPADQGVHLFLDVYVFAEAGEYAFLVRDKGDPDLEAHAFVTVVSVPTQKCVVAQDGTGDSTTILGCKDVFDSASGGDLLVEVADSGLYHENVDLFAFAPAAGAVLRVRAKDGAKPHISGGGAGNPVFQVSPDLSSVEGFTCRSGNGEPCFDVIGEGCTVSGNLVYADAGAEVDGIVVRSKGNLVSGNHVKGHLAGIVLDGGGATENQILHNLVRFASFAGITLKSAGPSNTISFNTLYDNGEAELYVQTFEKGATSGLVFTNNVVVAWEEGFVLDFQTPDVLFDFVTNWNDLVRKDGTFRVRGGDAELTTLAEWQSAFGFDADSISADPLFVEPGEDFHLRSQAGHFVPGLDPADWPKDPVTSPCVDAADPAADFEGEPAPNGGRANMGVYGGGSEASLSPKK